MDHSWRSLAVGAALGSLALTGLVSAPSEARGLSRIGAMARVGEDWYHARLKVSWKPIRVPGIRYQLRYASTKSALARSRARWSGTAHSAYTQPLGRGSAWLFQVRAYRNGVVGPWSRTWRFGFANRRAGVPVVTAGGLVGAVRFSWNYVPNASRYRVRWSPAYYGSWPGAATYTSAGWLNQYTRSATHQVPATPRPGDGMLAVPYANPVFARVIADNAYFTTGWSSSVSRWVPGWPTPPAPKRGDPVRLGTYNVMLKPTGARARSVARNISSHGVTVVALQEANDATGASVLGYLGGPWRLVDTASNNQQILYRSDLFTLLGSGAYSVTNPHKPNLPLVTPWARLIAVKKISASSESFYLTSVHYVEEPTRTRLQTNADTALDARQTMAAMNAADKVGAPIIIAGDLRYGREPYGDVAGYVPAQPTLVRAGYYDAMATRTRYGHTYSTVNNVNGVRSARQVPNASGVGPRSDYIMMKGIVGSKSYANIYNWTDNGSVPSDHNLIYSDLMVPPR
ncbi:hypothetical protein [Marmoricola sp. URHB0036]|uniref:hypothetical protein n=1 Tax=Marmoricola sp. URHB0036 TaxID=1298863 RepID=UPI0003F8145B|nr:hypothetical protein [Marmoricola sp. URHB0036]